MSSISGGGNITGNSTSETSQDKDNNHDNNKKRNTIDMVTKHFKGDYANIGAVIGLKHEIIDAKKDFEKFTQKILTDQTRTVNHVYRSYLLWKKTVRLTYTAYMTTDINWH